MTSPIQSAIQNSHFEFIPLFSPVKFIARILFALLFLPLSAVASNIVVNMSHYDLVIADFVAMKSERVVGVIHEATFPRLQRDWRYYERQAAEATACLVW